MPSPPPSSEVAYDAEGAAEARMVREVGDQQSAQLLQLGHHGSRTSTTPAFLSAVSPDIAVYSAGSGNSYEHPHASVLDRLAAADVETYGTDVHGTVTATTDGSGWRMATERDGTPTAGSGGGGSHDDHDHDGGADEPSATPAAGTYARRCSRLPTPRPPAPTKRSTCAPSPR